MIYKDKALSITITNLYAHHVIYSMVKQATMAIAW